MSEILRHLFLRPDWSIQSIPFPHIFSQNVFSRLYYNKLCHDSEKRFDAELGLRKHRQPQKLHYVDIIEKPTDSLGVFVSEDFLRFISNLFNIPITSYINMGLHYHGIGSPSSWVHNDLNPGWFIESQGAISFVSEHCNYKNGNSSKALKKIKVIRSIALIYYLDNPNINEISGGGTGLYSNSTIDLKSASVIIPPINNSILVFPCSPVSFHAFLSNNNFCRKSIIMWLHSDVDWTISKWGQNAIVPWEFAS